jgi:ABC-type amino acid transport substrate-binding protein
LDLLGTSSEALMALQGGSIDAMVVDEIYARYYLLDNSTQYD